MVEEFKDVVHPRHSAIIVIDIQNDPCHPDGAYAKSGRDISWRQKAAHNAAEFIDKTRKFNVPIIFTKGIHNPWVDSPTWMSRRKRTESLPRYWEGSWGAEFYAVRPMEGDAIVVKHRYSAFIGTDLELMLKSRRLSTLILTGGGTGACVESTARDGFMMDYDIVVVSDCCGTTSLDDHEPALKRMARLCGTVVESKELLDIWSRMGE